MARYDLSEAEWRLIEPLLPNKPRGVARADDRRVLNGIFWVLRSGAFWSDVPERYGPPTTIYNRFNRWSRRGFWLKLLDALVSTGAVAKSTAIDSTYIKAQRAAFGGKGGARRRRSVAPEADGQPKSTRSPMSSAVPMR